LIWCSWRVTAIRSQQISFVYTHRERVDAPYHRKMQNIRLTAVLGACLTIFPTFTNAFWRLPCRGRTGVARLDPIVNPGEVSGHAHAIHGGGSELTVLLFQDLALTNGYRFWHEF